MRTMKAILREVMREFYVFVIPEDVRCERVTENKEKE